MSKDKKEHFENDNLSIDLTRSENCFVKLDVKMTSESTKEAFKIAIKKIGKTVTLPGFRKGKVPESLIRKHFHKHLEDEVKNDLINSSLQQATKLANARPLSYQNIKHDIISFSEPEGASFSFLFDAEPVVEKVDLESIQLTKVEQKEITSEDVDNFIETVQTYHAKWNEITDRAVELNDYVELDIESLEDGKVLAKDQRFKVAPKKMGQWLIDLVCGLKKEESKEATSKPDDTLSERAKKKFQPTKCKVTIKGIFSPELPELDDEFAKKVGTSSIAQLKTTAMLQLKKEEESIVKQSLKEEIDEFLTQLPDFELPPSLLDVEIKNRIKRRKEELKKDKVSEKDIQKQESEIKEEAEKKAKEALKLHFITQNIAVDNAIRVTEDEVRQSMANTLSQMGLLQHHAKLPDSVLHELRTTSMINLLKDKVKEFIIKKATIK